MAQNQPDAEKPVENNDSAARETPALKIKDPVMTREDALKTVLANFSRLN
jgi:hypothetical protein